MPTYSHIQNEVCLRAQLECGNFFVVLYTLRLICTFHLGRNEGYVDFAGEK